MNPQALDPGHARAVTATACAGEATPHAVDRVRFVGEDGVRAARGG